MVMFAAPAMADPDVPVPVPAAPGGPAIPAPAPPLGPAPGPAPAPDGTVSAAAGALPTPPDGMPHLSSPQNLPPGTTYTPVDQGQPRTLGYLQDLWHAVQTQDISGKDALLLLAQRPLDPNAVPPGMSSNPAPPMPHAPPAAAPVAPPVP